MNSKLDDLRRRLLQQLPPKGIAEPAAEAAVSSKTGDSDASNGEPKSIESLVMKAAGIPKNASGLAGFVNGAHALVTPALVMVAAVAPLALIVGGLVLLFGGRRGMQIVGTSLGVLLLLGSVTALIA